MDKYSYNESLERIENITQDGKDLTYRYSDEFYLVSEVDALIAEMQAEIEADKEFRKIQWELDIEHDKEIAVLMEVLEAADAMIDTSTIEGVIHRIKNTKKLIKKAREVINASKN